MQVAKLNEILANAALASGIGSPNSIFGNVDDDSWLWLNTEGYRRSASLQKILPSMPDDDIQVKITGSAGDLTLKQGFRAYQLFKELYEENVGAIATCKGILDFGCGWGRIIRFFLKDVEASELYGIDRDAFLINICKETNRWCTFEVNSVLPPTSFAENAFDLIYCFSVFSHLSEDVHTKWLIEFHRILQPGGLLVATTRPREYIELFHALRKNNLDFSHSPGRRLNDLDPRHLERLKRVASRTFPDTQQALADYDAGNFCFAALDRREYPESFVEDTPIYGEACIPKDYVLDRWTKHFTYVDFIEDSSRCAQSVIVVKK